MARHVGVTAVDHRVEVAGLDHRDLGVVWNQQLGHAAEESEGGIVALDPVGELLSPGRTGERQARAAQYRHEQVGIAFLASPAVDHDRHRVAGIVDEHLLAAGVALAHDQRQSAFPAPEQVAPSAVPIAVRMGSVVFLPEDLQGDVLALQLARHHRPVRFRLLAPARLHTGHTIETPLQIGVRHFRRNWPGQPRPPKPPQRVADRRRSNPDPLANHPCRKPRIQAQTQNLARMAHRNPPRRHPFPPGRYPTGEMAQRSGAPHLKLRAIISE